MFQKQEENVPETSQFSALFVIQTQAWRLVCRDRKIYFQGQ